MKDKMLELHTLAKSTISVRPQIHFLKNGVLVCILRQPPATPFKTAVYDDPELAVDEAIAYIKERTRPVTFNDVKGNHSGAVQTIQKEMTM